MQLIRPSLAGLPSYAAALRRGWSPDNVRGDAAALEELAQIDADAQAFVAQQSDRDAKGPPIALPDGSTAARLPGYRFWLWDGEFCGVIGFRWQPGTAALPPHVLGHIGYAVVPWKRGLGYATSALRLLLPYAREEGLPWVEITTDPDNVASQRVVLANGGVMTERFTKPAQYGEMDGLRFRIDLRPIEALDTFASSADAAEGPP
jgi:predicted acetyltransferase